MSKRKVENFNNPAIFWQHYETYCLNMAISEKKKNPQNLMTLVQLLGWIRLFFSWSLKINGIYFEIGKNFPQK
jgi:hypothetical protein